MAGVRQSVRTLWSAHALGEREIDDLLLLALRWFAAPATEDKLAATADRHFAEFVPLVLDACAANLVSDDRFATTATGRSRRSWVVAAELPPERILTAVLDEVASLDPQLVVHRAAPMTEVIGREVSRERFALVLMGAFAAVALLLAALGLYGVLAYTVRQRTQEIGIRIALGATAAHVRTLVLRRAALVVGAGLAVGVLGALALGGGCRPSYSRSVRRTRGL